MIVNLFIISFLRRISGSIPKTAFFNASAIPFFATSSFILVFFKPPGQGVTVNEREIEISIPPGSILKRWTPGYGLKVVKDPTVGVAWQIQDLKALSSEFSVVFGGSGIGKTAQVYLLVAGILGFLVIVAVALYIRSRYSNI